VAIRAHLQQAKQANEVSDCLSVRSSVSLARLVSSGGSGTTLAQSRRAQKEHGEITAPTPCRPLSSSSRPDGVALWQADERACKKDEQDARKSKPKRNKLEMVMIKKKKRPSRLACQVEFRVRAERCCCRLRVFALSQCAIGLCGSIKSVL
jgi:hypothetical protein